MTRRTWVAYADDFDASAIATDRSLQEIADAKRRAAEAPAPAPVAPPPSTHELRELRAAASERKPGAVDALRAALRRLRRA